MKRRPSQTGVGFDLPMFDFHPSLAHRPGAFYFFFPVGEARYRVRTTGILAASKWVPIRSRAGDGGWGQQHFQAPPIMEGPFLHHTTTLDQTEPPVGTSAVSSSKRSPWIDQEVSGSSDKKERMREI